MKSIIKNIHLLSDIEPGELDRLEVKAFTHLRNSNIAFKIIENTSKIITIQIIQGKNKEKKYLEKKRLIEIINETFESFFPEKLIKPQPIPFKESPVEVVDAKWITKQMLKTKTKLKDIVVDTGIDNTQLSALTNNTRPLSQPMKALFWYYFETKRLQQQISMK